MDAFFFCHRKASHNLVSATFDHPAEASYFEVAKFDSGRVRGCAMRCFKTDQIVLASYDDYLVLIRLS